MNVHKFLLVIAAAACFITSCQTSSKNTDHDLSNDLHQSLNRLFANYYDKRMRLFPLEATQNGDNRYNNLLPNNITVAFRAQEKDLLQQYLDSLNTYDREKLGANDKMSYDVLKWELTNNLESLNYPDNLMPVKFPGCAYHGAPAPEAAISHFHRKRLHNFLERMSASVW